MSTRVAREDGLQLAHALGALRDERPFILGIARGGVVLADAVARALGAPLDVLLASKVRAADGRAIGGVAEGGALVLDDGALAELDLSGAAVERRVDAERARLWTRVERIRGSWPMPSLDGRTVVLVDDAVISGLTIRAAAAAVLARGARRVVVATPLCAAETSAVVAATVHDVIHLETFPRPVAARVHDDRTKSRLPLDDAAIHDLIVKELRDVGADPFGGLTIDGA